MEERFDGGWGYTRRVGPANIATKYFKNFKDRVDWIAEDLRTMLLARVQQPRPVLEILLGHTFAPETISADAPEHTTMVRKRIMFYLEHLLLSRRDSELFRSKCDRDLCRVLPMPRFQSVLAVTATLVMDILMLTSVVNFAKSADTDTRTAWILTAVFALILDLVVMETAQLLLSHVLAPHCIASAVRRSVLLLARSAVCSASEVSSWSTWFESIQQPTIFDGIVIQFTRLPLTVQDALTYALSGGGFAVLVLLSAELSRVFLPLAMVPWVLLYIIGYMARKLVGAGRRNVFSLAAVQPLVESKEEAAAAAASSPPLPPPLPPARRKVKQHENDDIMHSILHERTIDLHHGRAVGDYSFRFEDYRKKHAARPSEDRPQTAEEKAPFPSSRFHDGEDISIILHVDNKDDDYAIGELDGSQVRSPDNLLVEFYHVREDEGMRSDNFAMQSQLFRPPKEDADSHSEDGRFEFDRYDSDSSVSGPFI